MNLKLCLNRNASLAILSCLLTTLSFVTFFLSIYLKPGQKEQLNTAPYQEALDEKITLGGCDFKNPNCSSECFVGVKCPVLGGIDVVEIQNKDQTDILFGNINFSAVLQTQAGPYVFLFQHKENQLRFLQEPWKFIPRWGGFDAGQIISDGIATGGSDNRLQYVSTNVTHWLSLDGQPPLMFGNAAARLSFLEDMAHWVKIGDERWTEWWGDLNDGPLLTPCLEGLPFSALVGASVLYKNGSLSSQRAYKTECYLEGNTRSDIDDLPRNIIPVVQPSINKQECHANCNSCKDQWTCETCTAGYSILRGTCVADCGSGYFKKNGVCAECGANCTLCKNQRTCETCAAGFFVSGGACLGDCRPGYFKKNGSCAACRADCLLCTDEHTCSKCMAGRFLKSGSCLVECGTGFFSHNGTCTDCGNKCILCEDVQTCTSCARGFAISNGLCVSDCGPGYFNNYGLCLACSGNCELCLDENMCVSCSDGFFIKNGKCARQCSAKFFNASGVCTACSTNCDSCFDQNLCTKCANGHAIKNGQCVLDCGDGYFKDHKVCTACGPDCARCNNSTACTGCLEGKIVKDGTCTQACDPGYYYRAGVCVACNPGCATCGDENTCLSCVDGRILTDGACVVDCGSEHSSNGEVCIDMLDLVLAGIGALTTSMAVMSVLKEALMMCAHAVGKCWGCQWMIAPQDNALVSEPEEAADKPQVQSVGTSTTDFALTTSDPGNSTVVDAEQSVIPKLKLPFNVVLDSESPQQVQVEYISSDECDESENSSDRFNLRGLDCLLEKYWSQKEYARQNLARSNTNLKSFRPQLGHWRKGHFLGNGSLGSVFLARNESDGFLMVVRVVKVQEMTDFSATEIIEIQSLVEKYSKLEHPNIVKYLGAELCEGFLFIYQEYIPGGSLEGILKRFPGGQQNEIIRSYTKQILLGLEYLHKNGVAHHDVNAFNILVGENGTLKLHDFGLFKFITRFKHNLVNRAHRKDRQRTTSNPLLMPMNLRMQTGTGIKADIFGLGCVISKLCSGTPPWDVVEIEGDEQVATHFKILNSRDPPFTPRESERALREFVASCFQMDLDIRPDASDLLRHPFITSQGYPENTSTMPFPSNLREKESKSPSLIGSPRSPSKASLRKGVVIKPPTPRAKPQQKLGASKDGCFEEKTGGGARSKENEGTGSLSIMQQQYKGFQITYKQLEISRIMKHNKRLSRVPARLKPNFSRRSSTSPFSNQIARGSSVTRDTPTDGSILKRSASLALQRKSGASAFPNNGDASNNYNRTSSLDSKAISVMKKKTSV